MDRIGIAKNLHSIRREAALKRRGRRPAILAISWENLEEKDIAGYLDEVDEFLAALKAGGHIVYSEAEIIQPQKRVNPLKVVRKDNGKLRIIGG